MLLILILDDVTTETSSSYYLPSDS